MSRLIRNLSAIVFVLTVFVGSPLLAVTDCPGWVGGSCQSCVLTSWGYTYQHCPEDCGFNQWLCEEYCGPSGEDFCTTLGNGKTCGECDCGIGGPKVRDDC